ncbi:hypothetical protein ACHAW5_004532 [Stephanodiscus triporus]|uniref:C2H2-type domain-containing protein n=1 Tax=Stephanodiscus triporus TaxID=2934178 RepID=A0ABD3P3J2_9STRA
MGENNRGRSLKDDILSCLRGSAPAAVTRKEIQKQMNSSFNHTLTSDALSKKEIKHALKRLVKAGGVIKSGKEYSLISESEGRIKTNVEDIDVGDASDTLYVPIAQRMRKMPRRVNDDAEVHKWESNKTDLDEEIRRLEEDLAADTSESDDENDDDDENGEQIENGVESNKMAIHENDDSKRNYSQHDTDRIEYSDGIICLSNLDNARIEPLPQNALPQNKRRQLKGVDSKKRTRLNSSNQPEQQHTISGGLKHAVQDLLQNYVRPSQLDRPPFYCRLCQHQSKSQSEFDSHRASVFHKVAVTEEKKSTYCKLCRKQLTSVIQMEEHLKSRPHRDRMNFVKGKQRGLVGANTSVGRDGGRGGEGFQEQRVGAKSDQSGRQWC